ncbi:putative ubiquitin fusion degradation protein [Spironucleus salmonicida]|uniref:Ubiquitin fusion degradation protein n=1 Tax=Spironucleus salmonicida TaxID=348837 RepID=V6LE05_9EUKA|nr:putative ubiquitin fusion degradation protein [Spironucleus salmonicida]|eukprot:EST42697.1 Putative ubiquitin fusion degradation protein [Spironucleus salmonicida]
MSHKGVRLPSTSQFKPTWYKSYTLANISRAKLTPVQYEQFEAGGRIILPQQLLPELTDKNVFIPGRPLQFRIHSVREMITCFTGVQEFALDPASICIPTWIQEYIGAKEGDSIVVASMELPKCLSLTLKPETCEFYEIDDAKLALQTNLPNLSALQQGQNFRFIHNNKPFWMKVIKCEPMIASLIDTNVNCDFESAEGLEKYEFDKEKKNVFSMNAMTSNSFYQQGQTQKVQIIKKDEVKKDEFGTQSFGGVGRKL